MIITFKSFVENVYNFNSVQKINITLENLSNYFKSLSGIRNIK